VSSIFRLNDTNGEISECVLYQASIEGQSAASTALYVIRIFAGYDLTSKFTKNVVNNLEISGYTASGAYETAVFSRGAEASENIIGRVNITNSYISSTINRAWVFTGILRVAKNVMSEVVYNAYSGIINSGLISAGNNSDSYSAAGSLANSIAAAAGSGDAEENEVGSFTVINAATAAVSSYLTAIHAKNIIKNKIGRISYTIDANATSATIDQIKGLYSQQTGAKISENEIGQFRVEQPHAFAFALYISSINISTNDATAAGTAVNGTSANRNVIEKNVINSIFVSKYSMATTEVYGIKTCGNYTTVAQNTIACLKVSAKNTPVDAAAIIRGIYSQAGTQLIVEDNSVLVQVPYGGAAIQDNAAATSNVVRRNWIACESVAGLVDGTAVGSSAVGVATAYGVTLNKILPNHRIDSRVTYLTCYNGSNTSIPSGGSTDTSNEAYEKLLYNVV
jgi:hypothetical protein